MIDQETAEKMYLEQSETLIINPKLQQKMINVHEPIRLILNTLEVIGIFAIAIFLWI